MSPADYANMDPNTRDEVVRSRHLGIVRNNEELVKQNLTVLLTQPRQMPDGGVLPPLKHEDIVVLMMHRDDPITPEELKDSWEQQNIEVGVFFQSDRVGMATRLMNLTMEEIAGPGKGNQRPYKPVGRVLMQPAPPNTVYLAVFDCGMCTVLFVGFDPNNPDIEYINADPNVKPPPAVAPLELVENKPVGEAAGEAGGETGLPSGGNPGA